MMIKRLDSLSHNDTAATKTINDNFQALKEAVEDSLSRSGKTPNYMDADLDMNSRKIINVGEPVEAGDVVTLKYFKDQVGDAKAYSETAQAAAKRAESAAKSASIISQNINTNVKNIAEETAEAVVKEKTPDIVDEVLSKVEIPSTDEIVEEVLSQIPSGETSLRKIYKDVEVNVNSLDIIKLEGQTYPWSIPIIVESGVDASQEEALNNLIPTVVFADEQADSGNFSTVANSYVGSKPMAIGLNIFVTIYAKELPSENFTIPLIKLD